MNIAVKNKIVQRILESDDDLLLNEVNALLGLSSDKNVIDLPSEVKQAISTAHQQLDAGEGIPHDEVMQEVANRFLKK